MLDLMVQDLLKNLDSMHHVMRLAEMPAMHIAVSEALNKWSGLLSAALQKEEEEQLEKERKEVEEEEKREKEKKKVEEKKGRKCMGCMWMHRMCLLEDVWEVAVVPGSCQELVLCRGE